MRCDFSTSTKLDNFHCPILCSDCYCRQQTEGKQQTEGTEWGKRLLFASKSIWLCAKVWQKFWLLYFLYFLSISFSFVIRLRANNLFTRLKQTTKQRKQLTAVAIIKPGPAPKYMLGNLFARGVRETNRYCAALLVNKINKNIKHGKKPHTDRTATVDRCVTLCYKNGSERKKERESDQLQLIQSIYSAELMQLT